MGTALRRSADVYPTEAELKTTLPRLLTFGVAAVALLLPAAAQSQRHGTITGTVQDERGGFPLAGSTVRLIGQATTTVTDANGRFLLLNVPAGQHEVAISYLGYGEANQRVDVPAGGVASATFVLTMEAIAGDVIVVVGSRAGQARALQQQRTAVNITNVVASDQIGRFPDANIGDALKRIPGINVMVDQGEARFGLIRGTEPRFNSVTVNGERVPSAEGEVREVQLDLIPADMVAAVEVSKALTPNMDADAIGGTVNIVTRSTPSERRLAVTLGSGYNALSSEPIGLGSIVFGDRFADDRIGIVLNGSYHDHRLGSDDIEAEWEQGERGAYIADFQIREYQLRRVRRSAGAAVDFRLSPTSSLTWRGLFNWRDDWENRYRYIFEMDEPDATNIVTDATLVRQTKGGGAGRPDFARLEDQRAYMTSLTGEHVLGGRANLTWTGSYGRASETRPDERYIEWETSDVAVSADVSNPRKPRFDAVNPADAAPDQFGFSKIEVLNEKTWDRDMNGRIDLLVPFGRDGRTALEIGARGRFKQKVRDNRFEEATPIAGFDNLAMTELSDLSNPDFLAGDYRVGLFTDRTFLGRLDVNNAALFELESQPGEYGPANYDADERILAGYAQMTRTLDRLTILGGVRLESTHIDYNGSEFNEDTEELRPTTGSDNYIDVLPGLHVRYTFGDQAVLRLAWTNTLARPNYYDLVPYRIIVPEDNELAVGNPELRPTRSMNFDAGAERYFSSIGLVSAGVFYKRIRDFIFEFTQRNAVDPATGDTYDRISRPQNGTDADLLGLELALHRQLDFLPGVLRGLGVYANYTLTDSGIDGLPIEGREDEELPLPGTSRHTGNVSLSYELGRLSMRSSVNFASSFIDPGEVGDEPFYDRYYDGVKNLDLNGAFALSNSVRLFAEVNNLTNQPLRYYQGVSTRVMQDEYYNWRFTAGMKYDF
jgi:TonB-dependent receptor